MLKTPIQPLGPWWKLWLTRSYMKRKDEKGCRERDLDMCRDYIKIVIS